MPFEYSCFISYRQCQNQLGRRIVSELHKALCGELELLTELDVFLDTARMEPGYIFDEAIAQKLCRSVCLILIYTPTYFSYSNTYCAREYFGMEELEKQRLPLTGTGDDFKGLIIPVVFRGWDQLPSRIKKYRLCNDFAEFLLSDNEMHSHPNYAPKIKRIAEYVTKRCETFSALLHDPCDRCSQFKIPSEDQVRPLLAGIVPSPAPFPGGK